MNRIEIPNGLPIPPGLRSLIDAYNALPAEPEPEPDLARLAARYAHGYQED